MLRPYLAGLSIEFIQPIVPSPEDYLRQLLDGLYETEASKRPAAPKCSFCGRGGRVLASDKGRAAICPQCVKIDRPPRASTSRCAFCENPSGSVYVRSGVGICDGCLDLAISILEGDRS
jgi:hypothetical protein